MPTPESLKLAQLRLNAWRDRALDDLVRGALAPTGTGAAAHLRPAERRLDRRVSRDIDFALVRLGHGRYGLCDGCGGPIADDLLDAQPAATLCHACQASRECAAQH